VKTFHRNISLFIHHGFPYSHTLFSVENTRHTYRTRTGFKPSSPAGMTETY